MQIHELTYKRRVDEASFGGAIGGAKAIAGAIGSQLASTARQKILGTDVTGKSAAQKMYNKPLATPVVDKTATPAAPAAPTAQPVPVGVVPRAGHRIVVTVPTGGKYYKTNRGWTNEIGQAITKPASVAALEKRADASGREERLMPAKTTPPVRQKRRR
jgi:hypothetical protein